MKDLNGLKRRVETGELVEDRRNEGGPRVIMNAGVLAEKASVEVTSASPDSRPSYVEDVPKAPVYIPVVTNKVRSNYRYYGGTPDERNMAFAHAREIEKRAKLSGLNPDEQKVWFKVGYVRALRAMNLQPHIEFERTIAAAGIPEEALAMPKASMKVA